MIPPRRFPITPRLAEAMREIEALIASRYPEARFAVSEGEDPDGIYLRATVDVEDMGEVVHVFIDRLVEMQVEEGLPVYVVPIRPIERVLEYIRELELECARASTPLPAR
jgi:hypothetical protein